MKIQRRTLQSFGKSSTQSSSDSNPRDHVPASLGVPPKNIEFNWYRMFYHSVTLRKQLWKESIMLVTSNIFGGTGEKRKIVNKSTTEIKSAQRHLDKLQRVANDKAACQRRISNNTINQARKVRAVYQKSSEKPPVTYNLRINYLSICLSESVLQSAPIFNDLTGCVLEGSKFSIQLRVCINEVLKAKQDYQSAQKASCN